MLYPGRCVVYSYDMTNAIFLAFFMGLLIFALIGATAVVSRFLPADRPYDA